MITFKKELCRQSFELIKVWRVWPWNSTQDMCPPCVKH